MKRESSIQRQPCLICRAPGFSSIGPGKWLCRTCVNDKFYHRRFARYFHNQKYNKPDILGVAYRQRLRERAEAQRQARLAVIAEYGPEYVI